MPAEQVRVMPFDVMKATEYILRAPKGSVTLDGLLERVSPVPGRVLAACSYGDGGDLVLHIAVNSRTVFGPHFRSASRDQVEEADCLILSTDDPGCREDFLAKLRQGGVTVRYSYSSAPADGVTFIAAQTSDNRRAYELLEMIA